MVAAPTRPTVNYDRLAKPYFQALGRGQKPDQRPDLGPDWSPVADILEAAYQRAHGDTKAMANALTSLGRKYPALADLLAPPVAEPLQDENRMPPLPQEARLPSELSRGGCPWLDEVYVPFSRVVSPEGYDFYHPFCGVWLLSTIAARRLYIPLGQAKIYTNMMIALAGESTFFAKSHTANVAIRILKEMGLGYLLGPRKTSPQKLLSDMSGKWIPPDFGKLPYDKQERKRKQIAMAGQRGLYFDEFGKFVKAIARPNSSMADFDSIFLEFDESPDEYDTATISRSAEVIEKPYLTVLGPLTPKAD